MPLVLKYRADGINEQGAYLSLEVEPWEYDRIALHTLERLKKRKGEVSDETDYQPSEPQF